MGHHPLKRKDFLKNLAGISTQPLPGEGMLPGEPDPLFEKYSRKHIGNRRYSERVEVPGPQTAELRVGNITSGLGLYTGSWTIWEAAHLLRRTGFGVRKSDLDNMLTLSVSQAVDLLLTTTPPANPSPTPLNNYNNNLPDSAGVALGESWTSSNLTYVNTNDGTNNSYRQTSLTSWTWGLIFNENATIREKMLQFWYHFIPVDFDDVRSQRGNSATACNDYMTLLRTNGLGNFKTLIKAISKTPAMLVYLGNQFSTASVPNENFARELLELFSMGKEPTQNYTESDIISASKIFSGWRVASFSTAYPLVSSFNASYHNQTNKTFSAFFGNITIPNQTGTSGANELDIFIDLLFTQQQNTVARYVCRRLYRFFVFYDIDANVETNVIVPMANLLLSNNWEILPVVSTLLKSQHFYDVANKGVMIKSPIDVVAGTVRTLKINTTAPAGASQVINQYAIWNYFQSYANTNLEQAVGLVPNVSGWKAYYQAPTFYQNWINSNTIQRRSTLITSFFGGFNQGALNIKIDPILFVQQFPNATIQDPDLLIEAIMPLLFCVNLPASYKTETKIATLLATQVTNSYWTAAWNSYLANPTTTNINTVKTRLNSLLTTFLQLAEYQLM